MKKQRRRLHFTPRLRRTFAGFLVTLIFFFFAFVTHSLNTVKLPDAGVPTEIYASENSDDLRQLFKSAIASAQDSVHLLVYTLTDGTIIRTLKEKAEQGVDVQVTVDAKASPYAAQKLGPRVKTLRRLGMGLMHSKILVVDGKFVWLGSANMTADSLQMHSNLVLGMHSPALAAYLVAKAGSMTETGRDIPFARKDFQVGGQNIECFILSDEAQSAITRIKGLIRAAEKTVNIAMFTWTRQDFAHEVVKAAKRGVAVQVVIDNSSGKGASAKIVKFLKQNSIDVRLSSGSGLLHHKFMLVDKRILVNGSANWTKRAFGSNDECFVVLDGLLPEQREKLEKEWAVLYADSHATAEGL